MVTQAMLDEARAAYHQIVTGQGVQEARQDGNGTVRWHAASLAELRRYINQLETALGLPATDWSGGTRTPARRVLF
ncbi:gpW family head-tail joining protein [Methylobacterium nodulans]|uniref:Head-to-tail joining protein W gpW family protein n=1 Tax=Methylobacterium nodulans (strain LMG 21967 / CNCM I-2342 / ORS 2060) TaxID=460265 RepID=B8IDR2_METNO|nr:gpW family head-tail joining protein [Methylobacterium nodulans]ACL55634.1 Head-to-tail joining protein W gpW family protein [Methylobacterium nodulans ORS 2060]